MDIKGKTTMSYHFLAMLHRMRYINRWSLMRNTQPENLAEHTLQVALVAHALVTIRQEFFAKDRVSLDAGQVVLQALYHDASEILTGDLPTPVKYANPAIRDAYKAVEDVAAEKLLSLLPSDLEPAYRPLLLPDLAEQESAEARRLVKAADRICAYIKCLDEEKAGNYEFRQAGVSILATLRPLAESLPEVNWFIDNFLPSFELSLDELS